MSYTDKPALFSYNTNTVDAAGAIADNTDVFGIMIPANTEVEIQEVVGDIRQAAGASTFIEVTNAAHTVLCKIPISATGVKTAVAADGTTASTFPIRIAPQSTTAYTKLNLRTDGATDTSTELTIQVRISGL